MRRIEKYYENTKNALPHKNVKEFIKLEKKVGKAIDLGCGTGRDTVFLIKNNWNVLAIDRENTKEIIYDKLNEKEKNRFRFICQSFEEIELEKNDLIVANYSIPFCSKENFNDFWIKIVESINKNGYFVGNFFGINDSWYNEKENVLFLSKEQVLKLFESFQLLKFQEVEKNGKTGLGQIKHWHTFEIIAKKKH